ncbi:tetratricopeptide repeat protein [Trichocoleus desertorum AS-A10]|uniref:tetratricopeptide repeat protein n=1 Tax=Trichocoleus desertorum TaxID=1481672 RepID=UPI0032971F1F
MGLQTIRRKLLAAIGLISIITGFITSCTALTKQSSEQQNSQTASQLPISSPSSDSKADVLIQEGDKFFENDKLIEARLAYQKAAEINPTNAEAFAKLGKTLFFINKFDEAITAYQKAIKLNSKDIEAHNMLSSLLRIKGKRSEAIAVTKKVVQTDPDAVESHRLLGLLLAYEDNLTEASKACNRAIQIKPDYSQGHNCLGIILTSQGNLDKAISAHQKSIKLFINELDEPNQLDSEARRLPLAIVYYHLSLAFAAQDKRDEAVDTYNMALKISEPFFVQSENASHHPLGIDYFYRQVPLSSKHFAVLHKKLGIALKDTSQLKEAIPVLQLAKKLFSEQNGKEEIADIDDLLKAKDGERK